MVSFLLKSKTRSTLAESIAIPARARPAMLPKPGDRIFLFNNANGLVEEATIARATATALEIRERATCNPSLPASWLDGADRLKQTLRSKLHCDRHDRLWHLSAIEIEELDQARRR